MSKKLIAVASAVALAVAGFAALPSAATTSGASASAASPTSVPVPFNNTVEAAQLVTLTVSSSAGKTVSATSTGGVKLLAATSNNGDVWTSKDGSTSFSQVSAGADISIYAFTTSTATGSVVVNDGIGNTQTFYIKGTAGPAHNISASAPAFVGSKAEARVLVKVTDVFGNAIEGTSVAVVRTNATTAPAGGSQLLASVTNPDQTITANVVGGDATVSFTSTSPAASSTVFEWDHKRKAWSALLVGRSTDGQIALSLVLSGTAEVDGLAAPKDSAFFVVNSGDQTAQIAALQAKVDKMVTKKRFNTLARKWNAAFPSQKVALKK
jgi:hypothetical protein